MIDVLTFMAAYAVVTIMEPSLVAFVGKPLAAWVARKLGKS